MSKLHCILLQVGRHVPKPTLQPTASRCARGRRLKLNVVRTMRYVNAFASIVILACFFTGCSKSVSRDSDGRCQMDDYSIRIPKDWDAQSTFWVNHLVATPPDASSWVKVVVTQTKLIIFRNDFDGWVNANLVPMKLLIKEYKILDKKKFTDQDRTFYRVLSQNRNDGTLWRSVQFYTATGDTGFVITGSAPASQFEQYATELEDIGRSLRLK